MINYYSPYLYFTDLFKIPFVWKAKQKIIRKYQEYSGKKYVLITDSCRSALELAYLTIDKKGEVITSPLTCKVGIEPIINTNNKPIFSDIDINTLNSDSDSIQKLINKNTIAVQAIHLGGVSCDMLKIMDISKKYNLKVIEDCAQGYRAKFNDKNVGSFGHISCFSMMKNSFSIAGGVFATNDKKVFFKAKAILNQTSQSNLSISLYRIIRHLIETKKYLFIFERLFNLLIKLRTIFGASKSNKNKILSLNFLDLRIALIQLQKEERINNNKIISGYKMLEFFHKNKIIENYSNLKNHDMSFSKFFIYNHCYKTKELIKLLKYNSIEAKHLEFKQNSNYQEKLTNNLDLTSYHKVHDSIISLPIPRHNSKKYFKSIKSILIKYIKENRIEKNTMV